MKTYGRVKTLNKIADGYPLKTHPFYKELISIINNQEKRIQELESALKEKVEEK